MTEIGTDEVRLLCDRVKSRGARATAVHAFNFVKSVFEFARAHGYDGDNPARAVRPISIAALSLATARYRRMKLEYCAGSWRVRRFGSNTGLLLSSFC